ncbi:hypothetical protein [Nannocystis exedens]|nr:hypothetical protein [Nannocystis exedens]
MVLAWATLGVLDWFVYAFDDQLPQAVNPIQQVFEWLRLLFVVVGAVALAKHLEIAGER